MCIEKLKLTTKGEWNLLLLQVYWPYDGTRHQNLGLLNRKTHNEKN